MTNHFLFMVFFLQNYLSTNTIKCTYDIVRVTSNVHYEVVYATT